jgi:hypothetical protein
MIDYISELIIKILYKKKYIRKDIPIYRYYVELLVSTLFGILLVLLIGNISITIIQFLFF